MLAARSQPNNSPDPGQGSVPIGWHPVVGKYAAPDVIFHIQRQVLGLQLQNTSSACEVQ